jgi:hypothetical protein
MRNCIPTAKIRVKAVAKRAIILHKKQRNSHRILEKIKCSDAKTRIVAEKSKPRLILTKQIVFIKKVIVVEIVEMQIRKNKMTHRF